MEIVVILVVAFLFLLLINAPIAVGIALSTFLAILALGNSPAAIVVAQRIANGIDSFSLLAIPFFILSGELMGRGGMARRLIEFAAALMGRFPGGLGYVNVLTCMLFGSISGSATAAVSSIGGFMIPEMSNKGYGKNYSVAITTTAATTGLMIPPSNIMIVYALVSGGVSIAAMFVAGILPGIIFGVALMAVNAILSRRRGYGSDEIASAKRVLQTFSNAALSMLLVVIVLGGILGGVFTATEAAAIAVVYALLLGMAVYREVSFADLPGILMRSGVTTGIVFLLIGASSAMSWILAYENVPQAVSAALLALSDNYFVILLIINVLLLIVGTFMDMTPAVLIFTPILLPVVTELGMHPVHFGMILIANLCIGVCTPPVGTCLFVGCGVGRTTVAEVTGPLLPFFAAMVAALLAVSYIPELSLWLPRVMGLVE
jgi:tripartite ATP-independent transporter DctM subunit